MGVTKYRLNKLFNPKDIHGDVDATLWNTLQLYQQYKSVQLNLEGEGRDLKLAQAKDVLKMPLMRDPNIATHIEEVRRPHLVKFYESILVSLLIFPATHVKKKAYFFSFTYILKKCFGSVIMLLHRCFIYLNNENSHSFIN